MPSAHIGTMVMFRTVESRIQDDVAKILTRAPDVYCTTNALFCPV